MPRPPFITLYHENVPGFLFFFSAERCSHQAFYFAGGEAFAEEVVELCDGGFGGEVAAGNGSGLRQRAAGLVGAQSHRALRTLRTHRDHRTMLQRFFYQRQQFVSAAGYVACPEGLYYYAAQLFSEDLLKQAELNAGEDLDDPDGYLVQKLQAEICPAAGL